LRAPESFDGPYRIGVVALDKGRVLGGFPDDTGIGDTVSLDGTVEVDDGVAPLFE
jgi:hypothetical protein